MVSIPLPGSIFCPAILRNYSEDAAVLFSTHLISDIEKVLDEVAFLQAGTLLLHDSVETICGKKKA